MEPTFNPFSPDLPTAPHLLAGRDESLTQVEAALRSTAQGKPTHLLVISDPWLGKTSFALRAERLAQCLVGAGSISGEANVRFTPVFCSLGPCFCLMQVCSVIVNESARRQGTHYLSLIKRLLRRINGLKLGPFGIELESAKEIRGAAVSSFPNLLGDVLSASDVECGHDRVFLLILDDVRNAARTSGFASLLKALIELIGKRDHPKLVLLMTANPADFEMLCSEDDSFATMFRTIRLGPLSGLEVAELLSLTARHGRPSKAFTDDAIDLIKRLSAGYPGFVQLIGHAAFELCPGPLIDVSVARRALLGTRRVKGALASVADKHFRHLLDLEPIYARILDVIDRANCPLSSADIRKNVPRIKNLGPYLRKLMNRSAIRKLGPCSRPRYAIAAPVVSLWLHLQRVRTGRGAQWLD